MTPPEAYDRALRGDLLELEAQLPSWDSDAELGDWAIAGRWLLSLAQGGEVRDMPTAAEPLAAAELHRLRRALLLRDANEIAATARATRSDTVAELAAGWRDVFAGHASDRGTGLYRRAASMGLGELSVEATVLQAAEAAPGDRSEATSHARRASRMARTEGYWWPSYHAGLWLARLRRLGGRAHAAMLILSALRRRAPTRWQPALDAELLFAGRVPQETQTTDSSQAPESARTPETEPPLARLVGQLAALLPPDPSLEAAPHLVAFATDQGIASFVRRDLVALLASLPCPSPVEMPADVAAWRRGHSDDPPAALSGLATLSGTSGEARPPVTLAAPNADAVRVLDLGVDGSVARPPLSGSNPTRVELLASVMALHGTQPMTTEALFEAAYGFRYRPELHDASFRVLRHRAKAHYEGFASIQRTNEGYVFEAVKPIAIVDPRCLASLEERALRYLGQSTGASARDAAKTLGVPLRTIQEVLRHLVEEGAALAEREGRTVGYRVEDTTFQPLTTRHR